MKVYTENGDSIISVTDDKGTQKITMKDWKANSKYYDHKYGKIPPPPPPPVPAPPPPPKDPLELNN